MSIRRFNLSGPAVLVALLLAGAGALAVAAVAATPDAGEVSLESATATWEGEEFALGSTVLPTACDLPTNTVCDHYELTVDIPASHWDDNAGGVEVRIEPEGEDDDFDLYVYDKDDNEVGSSANGGPMGERVLIEGANAGAGPYRVEVVPYSVTQSGYLGSARVESRADVAGGEVPTEPVSNLKCQNGAAGPFPCSGIDLAGFLPRSSLGDGAELNDIWGWTDPQTKREYALVGKTDGTSFVDVTNPSAPRYLGDLPSYQRVGTTPVETIFNTWRDIKVHRNHAFVVSEEPGHGMQVFDLTRLRGVTTPQDFDEDAHYSFVRDGLQLPDPSALERGQALDNAHNIAINEETGFAYAIGTATCGGGGPHMIDIDDPKNPEFAGCVSEDGYTHDNQCVIYRGPDRRFTGREICFNSNEDTLTIVDVTDKDAPQQLSRTPYPGAAYSHQGWLTKDQRHFLLDDELDEQEAGGQTKTYTFDVSRLDGPVQGATYQGKTTSIDHNMYVRGDRVFQANYRSGLRVLDVSKVASGQLAEVGFFDVYPEDDEAEFNGSWSNYPYFSSGTVIVSGIEQGLFVLRPNAAVGGTGGGRAGVPAQGAKPPGSAAAPKRKVGRLPAGFGRHRFGAARNGAFKVRCRVRGTGRRVCRVAARWKKKGKAARVVGRGRGVVASGKRSTVVTVRLNRLGRRLLAKRPEGTPIRLSLRATDSLGRVAKKSRRASLRVAG